MSGKVPSMPQVSMPLRRIVIFLYLMTASAVPIPAAQATGGEEQSVKINIGKLQHEIKIHLDKIRQSGEKEVSVLDELARINGQLQQKQDKINNLQKRLTAQANLVELKEEELEQAEDKRNNLQRHMQKRLRSFYLMGKTGLLNVTFSKSTLPELMLFTDSYQRLISYDQSLFDMYRETVLELQRTKTARELEKSLLEEFIIQAKDEKSEILALSKDQKRLLYRITTERGLYVQAINEMRRAEYDLAKTLSILKERDDFKKRGFLLGKGTFPPPVPGTLAQQFGETVQEGFKKGDTVLGITIETDEEAPVRAIYAGKVIFAGYKRGYGNTVIIDHGLNYYSVTSRLDIVAATEGALIATGDQIGVTGEMATLFERGLYFEIRHKEKPLDPLTWLHPLAFASDLDLEAIHETWNSQDDEIIIVEETMPEAKNVPQAVAEVKSKTEPVEDVEQEGDIEIATEVKADKDQQDAVATKTEDEPEEEVGFFQSIGNALFGGDTEPEPEPIQEPKEDTSPKPATEVASEVEQPVVVALGTEVELEIDNDQQGDVAIKAKVEPKVDSDQQDVVELKTEAEPVIIIDQQGDVKYKPKVGSEADSDQLDAVEIEPEVMLEIDNDQQDDVDRETEAELETDKEIIPVEETIPEKNNDRQAVVENTTEQEIEKKPAQIEDADPEGNVVVKTEADKDGEQQTEEDADEEIGFFQSISNSLFGSATEPEPELAPEEDTSPSTATTVKTEIARQADVEPDIETDVEGAPETELEPEPESEVIPVEEKMPEVEREQQAVVEGNTETEPFEETVKIPDPTVEAEPEVEPPENISQPADITAETEVEKDNDQQHVVEIEPDAAIDSGPQDTIEVETEITGDNDLQDEAELEATVEPEEETGFFSSLSNSIFGGGAEDEPETDNDQQPDVALEPLADVDLNSEEETETSPEEFTGKIGESELEGEVEPERETPQKPEARKKKNKSFFENNDYL